MAAMTISAWRTTRRQVARARVADGDGGVAADQQQGGGHADDVRAAQHHGVRAFDLDAHLFEQVDAAVGGAGHEQRFAAFLRQAADVERREAVHVFFDADQRKDALFVDMGRHGQLDQDAVDFGVGVELFDQRFHLFLGGVGGQLVADRAHAQVGAGLLL